MTVRQPTRTGTVATPGTMRRTMSVDQPFASFEVCGRCYELRGPFDYVWKDQQYTFVQECRCERDARPRDERPETWMSFDFNTAAELCNGCGAEVLRERIALVGLVLRRVQDPRGRTQSSGRVRGRADRPALDDARRRPVRRVGSFGRRDRRVRRALRNLVERIQLLDDWSHEVVRRNLDRCRARSTAQYRLAHLPCRGRRPSTAPGNSMRCSSGSPITGPPDGPDL